MEHSTTPIDTALAHQYFSADCFNRAWALIEKAQRTPEENEEMILSALASLWHWTQRADHTPQNLSIAHWQVSRTFSLLKSGENAMHHARQSLKYSIGLEPFFVGYAHEATARAAALLKDQDRFSRHLKKARAYAIEIADAQERDQLEKDLKLLIAQP
ncbi:MAG: hypothetical protein M3O30_09510 [Planctomycetota bacterium]|nr:hypothetical protein [Planctomycetota bacterium]